MATLCISFSDGDTPDNVVNENQKDSDTLIPEDDEKISVTTDQISDIYIQGTLNDLETESKDDLNAELVKTDEDINVMPFLNQDCEEPECDSQIDDIFDEDGKGDDISLKTAQDEEELGEKLVSVLEFC